MIVVRLPDDQSARRHDSRHCGHTYCQETCLRTAGCTGPQLR